MLQFCKAMADESRLKIVGLLSAAEHSVQQLASALELREPTVSHHLAILKKAGLLAMRVEGNTHWYRLDLDALRRINRSVFSAVLSRFPYETDGQVWEREILHTFIEDDRLTKIPDTRKKRWVVLKWLARGFALDSRYSEAEVNAVLKRYHSDVATLRRELVGYRMLERNKGIYRRTPESGWKAF